jgi:hypothetical protein
MNKCLFIIKFNLHIAKTFLDLPVEGWTRDVDGISRSQDIPRNPGIKKSRDYEIPGF